MSTIPPMANPERQLLMRVTQNRRQRVLSIVVPGLLMEVIFTLLIANIPRSPAYSLLLGMSAGVFAVTVLGMVLSKTALAANALVIGMTAWTGYLIYLNGPSSGYVTLQTLQSFFLFLIPIILAGILSTPLIVALTTSATFVFSVAVLMHIPIAANAQQIIAEPGNNVLLRLPLFSQVGLGFLLIAGAYSFQRMQRELVAWRLAYSQEHEIDRLREQFIASVNHELRNPIMAVQGYFVLAKELSAKNDSAGLQRMLARGIEVSTLLAQMVESILSVRKLKKPQESIELSNIDVYHVVAQVTHMRAMLDTHGEHRIQEIVPLELTVIADETLLVEVLSNVLANAAKYSPAGTDILISAKDLTQREASRLVPIHLDDAKGPLVEITIQDHGIGIPPDKAPLIFEPFIRLERDEHSSVVGSGLGLAICRSHVQAMQGAIWVESTGISGEGSTFHILLQRGQPLEVTAKMTAIQSADTKIE